MPPSDDRWSCADEVAIIPQHFVPSLCSVTERADAFGTQMMEAEVPRAKVFFYNRLIPKMVTGEDEYIVIGGLHEVSLLPF